MSYHLTVLGSLEPQLWLLSYKFLHLSFRAIRELEYCFDQTAERNRTALSPFTELHPLISAAWVDIIYAWNIILYIITEFEIIDSKNPSTAYALLYELIGIWVLDSIRRVGVWLLPWRWHILSILFIGSRGICADTCGLDDVFPPDDLYSRPETLC